EISYYPGYLLKGVGSQTLVDEAVAGANKSDIAIIFAGLTGEYESEGFDRNTLSMPESQNELIRRVAAAQPNTVVVLAGGAPVEMPWLPQVKAVLNMLLSGQAGGLAAADILTGKVNPSGKLAATYPIRYADVPSAGFYEEGGRQAQYRESIYVGYRYYDKAGKEVLFPFGHGLSYTTFEYRDLSLSSSEMQAAGALKVAVTVKNTGKRDGAEIVQLYIGDLSPGIFRPEKELRDFSKIFLNTGEEKQVEFTLDSRAFSFYDPHSRAWMVPEGVYQISVGSSSRDIRLQDRVTVRGAIRDLADASIPAWYRQLTGKVSSTDFESILGRPIEPVKSPRAGEYSLSSTFQEMRESLVIRMVMRYYMKILVENYGSTEPNDPNFRMVVEGFKNKPLKNMVVMSKGVFPPEIARGLVDIANGKLFKGAMRIIRNKSSSHKK
ncbi:MAG: glycoside hydrolase family 3 C-terminal domain-containing protein, partial [Bellilinea sp.]